MSIFSQFLDWLGIPVSTTISSDSGNITTNNEEDNHADQPLDEEPEEKE